MLRTFDQWVGERSDVVTLRAAGQVSCMWTPKENVEITDGLHGLATKGLDVLVEKVKELTCDV